MGKGTYGSTRGRPPKSAKMKPKMSNPRLRKKQPKKRMK